MSPPDIPLDLEPAEYIKIILAQAEIIETLKARISKLEAELENIRKSQGQSLSTPSLKQFPKSTRLKRGSRPRGAPKGHRGASLQIPVEVDEVKIHSPEVCPRCGCKELGKETNGWENTTFDFNPMPLHLTRHVNKRRWCPQCRKKVSLQNTETLPNRNYGPNIATFSAHLQALGIPLGKIQLIIENLFRHRISRSTLMDLGNLVGSILRSEYGNLSRELKMALAVNGDETSFRIDGKLNWAWTFVWENGVIYVIDPSRGKSVPLDVLGEDFEGCLGHDGWAAYNLVGGFHQTGYIHLNRNIAQVELNRGVEDRGFLKPTPVKFRKRGRPPDCLLEYLNFADQIRTVMRDAVAFTERAVPRSSDERQRMYDQLLKRLDKLVAKKWNDKDTVRFCKRLDRIRGDMFTFVVHPEISWNNNIAERAVRAVATIRNNSGGRRTRVGAVTLETILSIFETWKMRGLNVFQEARSALIRGQSDLHQGETMT